MPATLPNNASQGFKSIPVKSRKLFFLLALLLVLLVAAVAVFAFKPNFLSFTNNSSVSFVKRLKTQTSNLEFPSPVWKERLDENFSKIQDESDEKKQYEAFLNLFEIISSVYSAGPKQATREVLDNLNDFVKDNYEEFYQEERFTITCLDEGCQKENYPGKINEILIMINEVGSFDSGVKEKMLLSLRKASFSKESSEAWPHYDSAFQLINSEYKKTHEEKLKEALTTFATFIKDNYPKDYESVLRAEGEDHHYKVE